MPVFIGSPFRASLLLPKNVCALAQMRLMSAMPELLRATIRTTFMLPQQLGSLSNNLIQTLLCLRQHGVVVAIWFELSTPIYVHLGSQTRKAFVRHQLCMGSGL